MKSSHWLKIDQPCPAKSTYRKFLNGQTKPQCSKRTRVLAAFIVDSREAYCEAEKFKVLSVNGLILKSNLRCLAHSRAREVKRCKTKSFPAPRGRPTKRWRSPAFSISTTQLPTTSLRTPKCNICIQSNNCRSLLKPSIVRHGLNPGSVVWHKVVRQNASGEKFA